jgi:hypothetical protein
MVTVSVGVGEGVADVGGEDAGVLVGVSSWVEVGLGIAMLVGIFE